MLLNTFRRNKRRKNCEESRQQSHVQMPKSHWFLASTQLNNFNLISLACVSSETNNLQCVFAPGGWESLIQVVQVCAAPKGFFFQPFWFEMGHQFRPFWSETGYGLCLLVLNWVCLLVCFLEELATSSSFGDKTISLLMFTPATAYLPYVTACHVLRSRVGLQCFRSEIGYQIFDQV